MATAAVAGAIAAVSGCGFGFRSRPGSFHAADPIAGEEPFDVSFSASP